MSFSHSGDFEKILSNMNIKVSQDEGQGRTTPIPRNSLDKGAFFLQGGACPKDCGAAKFCWIMAAIQVKSSSREAAAALIQT
jgi:hypothetical protein